VLTKGTSKPSAVITDEEPTSFIFSIPLCDYRLNTATSDVRHNTYFLEGNNFSNITNDPTEKFQKSIRQGVHKCNLVINKLESWKLFNMNPKAPSIKGLIKIHKNTTPLYQ
jgi:hypothetical protein